MVRIPTHRPPTHPGEMLRAEFLEPLGLTQTEVAGRLGISLPRLNELVNGKRGVTTDTALRLGRLFDTSPAFWLNLQTAWDLYHALHGPSAAEIRKIRPLPQLADAAAGADEA